MNSYFEHQMMTISRFLLIAMIYCCISCSAQNKESASQVLVMNEAYSFFHSINSIDLEELDKRRINFKEEDFESLTTSISKKTLDSKIITLFHKYFTIDEINKLYQVILVHQEDYSNQVPNDIEKAENQVVLSEVLRKKRDSIYQLLYEEEFEVLQNFKRQLHILDSINYDPSKNEKSLDVTDRKIFNSPNGIYEATIYEENNQDQEAFINSILVKELPGVTFNNIDEVEVVPQAGTGLFYTINVLFNDEGKEQLHYLSENNLYKPLPIIVGKHIVMAPFINDIIAGGEVSVSGNITYAEARVLKSKLESE